MATEKCSEKLSIFFFLKLCSNLSIKVITLALLGTWLRSLFLVHLIHCFFIYFSSSQFEPVVLANIDNLDSNALSSYPLYLDQVECIGNETNLLQCDNLGAGVQYCCTQNIVAIRCNGNFIQQFQQLFSKKILF